MPPKTRKTLPKLCRVDAVKAASLEETYRRAEKAQYKFLLKLEADGRLQTTDKRVSRQSERIKTAQPAVGRTSRLADTLRAQEDTPRGLLAVSTSLWDASNPGYFFGATCSCSATRTELGPLTAEEARLAAAQRVMDGDHGRQRNDMSAFVEASAKAGYRQQPRGKAGSASKPGA